MAVRGKWVPDDPGISESDSSKARDVRPPSWPWAPLEYSPVRMAAVSFYYSDPNSNIPVRDITGKNGPKPDPNIETETFGLFSICHKSMRASVVRKRMEYLFFCTNRHEGRVLSGYYRIGWYYKLPDVKDDFVLAAREARFVTPGFPVKDLPPLLRNLYPIHKPVRVYPYIKDTETIERLLLLLRNAPDARPRYISEIHRLEKSNVEQYGWAYRKDRPNAFRWTDAPKRMKIR